MTFYWFMFIDRVSKQGLVVQAPTEFMAWAKLKFTRPSLLMNYHQQFETLVKKE